MKSVADNYVSKDCITEFYKYLFCVKYIKMSLNE